VKILTKEQLTALRDIITPDNLQSLDENTRKVLDELINDDENINAVSLYIDGAADLNTKIAGIGGVFLGENNAELYRFSEYLDDATNNEAEYSALIRGLQIGLELNIINIKIYADSELVVKQVSGEYKVKHERMRPLHRKAIALLSQYSNWSLQHVPRNDNTIADKLSKEGMDQGR
jgi:ribonuclease HI